MPTFVADEIVTAAKLNAGTARDWDDWTPTLTGITQGNGTIVARYVQVGKLVHAYFKFVFGSSGSAMSGGQVSLPVAANDESNTPIGNVVYVDTGTTTFFGWLRLTDSTTAQPMVATAGGTFVAVSGCSSTIPMTWVVNDVLTWTATYEAA